MFERTLTRLITRLNLFIKEKRLADNELNYFKAEFTYVNEHLK